MAQVFISYRQINHSQSQRVREFAERVRARGVEVILDQFYKETHPGASDDGWTLWSENQAEDTEKVLVIATPEWFQCYLKKAPPGVGLGAAAEAHVIRARITKAGTRFRGIRIVELDEEGKTSIPLRLADFPRFDVRQPGVFEEMIAWIGGDAAAVAKAEPPKPARHWVWKSSLASRAAGQKSVLACVETALAVAGYWWIAWRWDTHWHLVSSVIIAPLLLLRSPESIAAGMRWFSKDWFGFESNEKDWTKQKKRVWRGAVGLLSASATYCISRWLVPGWLPRLAGTSLVFLVAEGVASAVVGTVKSAVLIDAAFVGAWAGAGAWVVGRVMPGANVGWVSTGALFGAVSSALLARWVRGRPNGPAFVIRATLCRMLATLVHLRQGVAYLPENWQENNFVTDSSLPAELLPGIRDSYPEFSLDGSLELLRKRKYPWWRRIYTRFDIFAFFLPAFLYRVNIKATAWFWWPLALLLKPVPTKDGEHDEMEAMCSPWTNPVTMIWTLFSVLLGVAPLLLHFTDFTTLTSLAGQDRFGAIPASWETFLSIRWSDMAPWNLLQLLTALSGAGILWLASTALSQRRNGNWDVYRRNWAQNHGCMTFLRRINFGSSMAVMALALGALIVQEAKYRAAIPAPVVQAMDAFYNRWTPQAKRG